MERKDQLILVGAGALGCALLPLMIGLPFRKLKLIDGDTIEERNLVRQPLYGLSDVSRAKVEVAEVRMHHLAPKLEIETHYGFVSEEVQDEVFAKATLIIDCTDDLHVRMLIDRYCAARKIPLVSGSVFDEQAQVLTLHVPCANNEKGYGLRDYYPGRIGPEQDGCDMQNVPVMVPTMAAARMAWRVRDLLQGGTGAAEYMDLFDLKNAHWLRIGPPTPPGEPEFFAKDQDTRTA